MQPPAPKSDLQARDGDAPQQKRPRESYAGEGGKKEDVDNKLSAASLQEKMRGLKSSDPKLYEYFRQLAEKLADTRRQQAETLADMQRQHAQKLIAAKQQIVELQQQNSEQKSSIIEFIGQEMLLQNFLDELAARGTQETSDLNDRFKTTQGEIQKITELIDYCKYFINNTIQNGIIDIILSEQTPENRDDGSTQFITLAKEYHEFSLGNHVPQVIKITDTTRTTHTLEQQIKYLDQLQANLDFLQKYLHSMILCIYKIADKDPAPEQIINIINEIALSGVDDLASYGFNQETIDYINIKKVKVEATAVSHASAANAAAGEAETSVAKAPDADADAKSSTDTATYHASAASYAETDGTDNQSSAAQSSAAPAGLLSGVGTEKGESPTDAKTHRR